jgi:phage terminase small subunit
MNMPEHKTSALPKPPKHLRSATAKWFRTVVEDFDLEAHEIRLLTLAAEAWDQGQAAREIVAEKGMTFDDRFGQPKARPEVAIERDSRIGFARLLRELALDLGSPDEGRPPALPANRGY